MKTVIPAAGDGTRLDPLTRRQPKALIELGGRPLVAYAMDAAVDARSDEIIVIVKDVNGPVYERLGHEHDGVPVSYVSQSTPRGLGHAVQQASGFIDESFTVILGDTVFTDCVDSVPVVTTWTNSHVILYERVPEQYVQRYAAVYMSNDVVTSLDEKSPDASTRCVDTGVYSLPPEFFDLDIEESDSGEQELQTGINMLIEDGHRFRGVEYHGDRVNVNTATDLASAKDLL